MIVDLDNFPGRTLSGNGKTYHYFGGTAYLGLQTDKAFLKLYIENIKKYGANYSASRKSNVRFSVYEEGEAALADVTGSETCITLSSGYLTGQLVRNYFDSPEYECFYAPDTHPALHRENTKNHNSYEDLRESITIHLKKEPFATPVLYFDTINLNKKEYPGLDWLKQFPLEKLILVADDSHGFGITGNEGGGSYKKLKELNSKALVVCGSLGKGFGIAAGGVFGTRSFINELMETDMFIASSPAAPHSLATFLQARSIYARKRKLLLQHINTFAKKVNHMNHFVTLEAYPVFQYTDDTLSDHLLKNNIIVTHFKYPNDSADTISKIVLSAHHTGTDILYLTEAVNRYPTRLL